MSPNKTHTAFTRQGFMQLLNAHLTHTSEGECHIEIPFRPEVGQQHGLFHGGVLATLADNTAGFAAFSLMDPTQQPLTVEFKISFITKAKGEKAIGRAKVLKNGRTLKICRADIYVQNGDDETLCATALATIIATVIPGY